MSYISQTPSPPEPMNIQQVIRKYQQLIYGIALTGTGGNRADAEDVFQETFLAYFQANKTFQEEEHRKAWLIRTACNHCKKITGSTYRKRTVPLTDTTPLPVLFSLPEDNALFSALCSLKPTYRNVLYLHYFAGYRTEEIAKLLGKRAGTIRMQLLRGREQLRNQLQKEEEPVYEPKAMQTHV